jgi:hypothetical protein
MEPNSSDEVPRVFGQEDLDRLRVPNTGICWWCEQRPATTGEHKFKRTDLARMMKPDGLMWGDGEEARLVRGSSGIKRDRYGVVKFPKSMCDDCNNRRSKRFDNAYEKYSEYLDRSWLRPMPGINFLDIFGDDWQDPLLNVARYYGKHFGCRMLRSGVPVPDSLRAFLDGASDMPDAHMALVTTDSVHKRFRTGLYISPDYATTDAQGSRFTSYISAAYIGSIGVRYAWYEAGLQDRSQFFHYPMPVVNHFSDEQAVIEGRTRRQGWFRGFSSGRTSPAREREQARRHRAARIAAPVAAAPSIRMLKSDCLHLADYGCVAP